MGVPDASELAETYGIRTQHDRMPNGELRFRMYGPDGNGYVRVLSGPNGAWQNSHYHNRVRETYIVESGWIALAEFAPGRTEVVFTILHPGGIVTTEPDKKHNVYVAAGTLIHVVKHGGVADDADWIAAPDLDSVTKCLSESQLLARAKRSHEGARR